MIKESLPTIEKTEEQQIAELKKELFDRECPKEYEPLIAGVKLIKMQTPYAEDLYREFKDAKWRDLVKNKIKNQVVLDLGCGSGLARQIAKESESKLYIGVDIKEWGIASLGDKDADDEWEAIVDDPEEEIGPTIEYPIEIPEPNLFPKFKIICPDSLIKTLGIKDDMLHTISQLKNESIGAVIVTGIESNADSDDNITHKYLTSLAVEIKRVLKLGGILIKLSSDVSDEGMNRVVETRWSDVNIFEKIN